MCVHVPVCGSADIHVSMWRAEENLGCCSSSAIYLSLALNSPCRLGWLAMAPWVHLPPPRQPWILPQPDFLAWVLGGQTQVAMLASKILPTETSSQPNTLYFYFFIVGKIEYQNLKVTYSKPPYLFFSYPELRYLDRQILSPVIPGQTARVTLAEDLKIKVRMIQRTGPRASS